MCEHLYCIADELWGMYEQSVRIALLQADWSLCCKRVQLVQVHGDGRAHLNLRCCGH